MIKNFDEFINEKFLNTVKRKFSITVDIESTKHAEIRQSRHLQDSGVFITDEDILKLMTRAIEDIFNLLAFDRINIGDEIVLKDNNTKLNVACAINGQYPKLILVAKTVMIHDNFKVGKDQLVLTY